MWQICNLVLYQLFCSNGSALFPLSVKLIWMLNFCRFLKHILDFRDEKPRNSLQGHPLAFKPLLLFRQGKYNSTEGDVTQG